jgi:CDP-diacylglycerol--serine O-phosphatidyltransferase
LKTIKKHIPNLITLANLFCGLVAIVFALKGDLVLASFFILLGIFFDFFDGFFARLLNVSGELGKQLDSLADMVTSGVAPTMIMYKLLEEADNLSIGFDAKITVGSWLPIDDNTIYFMPFFAFLLALAAGYRLANFNIDKRQSDKFIGIPTPAMALVVLSIPLILEYSENTFAISLFENSYLLIILTILLSFLMNANFELFSLKFKNYTLKANKLVYTFLLISIILIILLKFVAIPIVILLYVLLSLLFKNY